MERLTSYKSTCKREMICRYEDCDTCEEYCPYLNEDNCPCLQEVLEKLGKYEDLEEQGKLLKLPCAVGDMVYKIYPNDLTDRVLGLTVVAFSNKAMELYGDVWTPFDEIGKTVFLAREEAEAALKEL